MHLSATILTASVSLLSIRALAETPNLAALDNAEDKYDDLVKHIKSARDNLPSAAAPTMTPLPNSQSSPLAIRAPHNADDAAHDAYMKSRPMNNPINNPQYGEDAEGHPTALPNADNPINNPHYGQDAEGHFTKRALPTPIPTALPVSKRDPPVSSITLKPWDPVPAGIDKSGTDHDPLFGQDAMGRFTLTGASGQPTPTPIVVAAPPPTTTPVPTTLSTKTKKGNHHKITGFLAGIGID